MGIEARESERESGRERERERKRLKAIYIRSTSSMALRESFACSRSLLVWHVPQPLSAFVRHCDNGVTQLQLQVQGTRNDNGKQTNQHNCRNGICGSQCLSLSLSLCLPPSRSLLLSFCVCVCVCVTKTNTNCSPFSWRRSRSRSSSGSSVGCRVSFAAFHSPGHNFIAYMSYSIPLQHSLSL